MAFQYQVRAGQTPTSIAGQFNLNPTDLLRANRGATPFDIGQTIQIPGGGGRGGYGGGLLPKPSSVPGYGGSAVTPPRGPGAGGALTQVYGPQTGLSGLLGLGRSRDLPSYAPYRTQPQTAARQYQYASAGPNPQALPRINAPRTLRVGSEEMVTGRVPNYKADIVDMIRGGTRIPDQLSPWQAEYANQLFAEANPLAPPLYINGVANPEITQSQGDGAATSNYRGGSFDNRFFQLSGEKSGGFIRGRGGDRNWGARGRRRGGGAGGGGGGGGSTPAEPKQQLFGLINFSLRASTG